MCSYVRTFVYVYILVCTYVCTCTRTWLYVCTCRCVLHMSVCIGVRVHTCVRVRVCLRGGSLDTSPRCFSVGSRPFVCREESRSERRVGFDFRLACDFGPLVSSRTVGKLGPSTLTRSLTRRKSCFGLDPTTPPEDKRNGTGVPKGVWSM